eukprot:COSAG03_NODE_100_length_12949_cov_130.139611_2_plen_117_part_00
MDNVGVSRARGRTVGRVGFHVNSTDGRRRADLYYGSLRVRRRRCHKSLVSWAVGGGDDAALGRELRAVRGAKGQRASSRPRGIAHLLIWRPMRPHVRVAAALACNFNRNVPQVIVL